MNTRDSSPRVQDDFDDNDDDDGPFGEEINNNDGDLGRVREVTYMYGIRAIAALYRHFERTVRQPILTVGIEYVLDSDDDADTFDDADFYGKVTVNGRMAKNRGEEALDTEEVNNPGWVYGATVPLTGTVPVHIEFGTRTGESPCSSFNGPDDLIDIDPDESDDDSTWTSRWTWPSASPGRPMRSPATRRAPADKSWRRRATTIRPSATPSARNCGSASSCRTCRRSQTLGLTTSEDLDITLDGSGSFDPEGKPLTRGSRRRRSM